MEFVIRREDLVRELQTVTGVVEKRATLPILANLLLEAGPGGLEVGASDLEVTVRGTTKATVRKRLLGIRDHYIIEVEGGEDLKAHGNIVDHEYEIECDGDTVAVVSKKWFRIRDTYGVEIAPDQNAALVLAVTVAVDTMAHPAR